MVMKLSSGIFSRKPHETPTILFYGFISPAVTKPKVYAACILSLTVSHTARSRDPSWQDGDHSEIINPIVGIAVKLHTQIFSTNRRDRFLLKTNLSDVVSFYILRFDNFYLNNFSTAWIFRERDIYIYHRDIMCILRQIPLYTSFHSSWKILSRAMLRVA